MHERWTDRRRLFWALHLGGWLAFGLAMAFSRMGTFPLWYMAVNKGVLTVLGAGVSLVLWAAYRPLVRRSPSPLQVIVVSVACSYIASLVWTAGFNVSMAAFHTWYDGQPFGVRGAGGLFSGAVYHAFTLFAWSVLYFGVRYYHDSQAAREQALRAEALAHAAQLRALRYQLNPHFLFNTLNAVSTLVAEGDNGAANRMLARLSDFLRLTLDGDGTPEVALVDELAFVQRYLDIEQVRFGDRLRVRVDADPDVYGALVPALFLQPLVENAVRYAVAPREEGGRIAVTAGRVDDALRVCVRDDGPGLPAGGWQPGVGLTNTRRRLEALYGDTHRFTIRSADGGGAEVVVDLPLRTATARPTAPATAAPVAST